MYPLPCYSLSSGACQPLPFRRLRPRIRLAAWTKQRQSGGTASREVVKCLPMPAFRSRWTETASGYPGTVCQSPLCGEDTNGGRYPRRIRSVCLCLCLPACLWTADRWTVSQDGRGQRGQDTGYPPACTLSHDTGYRTGYPASLQGRFRLCGGNA